MPSATRRLGPSKPLFANSPRNSITGSNTERARLIRSKQRREGLAKRFKNPSDPFKLVIVRDMWLTGFDAPCMHTMYIDKPMQGHGLMQAIARVNRVFRDKPGGLVVDYLGLADELKKALHTYTDNGGQGETALDQEEAVALMLGAFTSIVAKSRAPLVEPASMM